MTVKIKRATHLSHSRRVPSRKVMQGTTMIRTPMKTRDFLYSQDERRMRTLYAASSLKIERILVRSESAIMRQQEYRRQ